MKMAKFIKQIAPGLAPLLYGEDFEKKSSWGDAYKVHADKKAYWAIYQEYRKHRFIQVLVDNDPVPYQSIILDMNLDMGHMIIDELFPSRYMLRQGQALNIEIRLDNQQTIDFQTRVIGEQIQDGAPVYRLALPEYAAQHQRREAFRLELREPIYSRCTLPDHRSESARVRDLSAQGLALELDGDQTERIHSGEIISDCVIKWRDLSMRCDFEVKRTMIPHNDINVTLVGGEISSISAADQRELTRFIMEQQRLDLQRVAVAS